MKLRHLLVMLVMLALIVITSPVIFPVQAQTLWTKFRNVHVEHNLDVDGDVDVDGTLNADEIDFDGDMNLGADLTVTGDTALGDAAGDTTTVTGDMTVAGLRDGTTGYDYFLTISGDIDATANNAKTYGLYCDMERTVANVGGNIDESCAKLRYKTSATSRVAGIVANGIDVEAKTDDDHHAGTIRGAQITAVGDAGSTTDTAIALRAHAEMSGNVTNLQVADFELNRKDATEPTTEYGINVRNTSSLGTGADVGYRLETSAGAGGADANADWVYGIDLNPAVIVTSDIRLQNEETIANTTDGQVDIGGKVVITGAADAVTDAYDHFLEVTGEMTGVGTKDRNYGVLIEMTRPAGQEVTTGDHDEAGLKIRIDTEAVTTTTGTVLRAIDAEAKADNPDGTVTNLFGASIGTKSDTGAGSVAQMIALQSNAQNNAAVTTALMSADFRLMRQAATEPTSEYVVQVRNSSTSGTGADAGIYLNSDYAGSATTDAMDYGIDMSSAAINTADLRLENGETINNGTDTAVQIGGFLALTEGTVIDLANGATITPTASYQPLTCSGAEHSTTDATTAIADGPVAGSLLILCNEDATYNVVVKDGANTILSGDITLTANQQDCLTLLWNGADWVGLSDIDN